MKIRNGFVSNSSSSSFVVYGTDIIDYKIRNDKFIYMDLCECEFMIQNEKGYYECSSNCPNKEKNICFNNEYEFFNNIGLECHNEGDNFYVGFLLERMTDNKNLGQIKKEVIEKINSILEKPVPEENFGIINTIIYG